MPLGDNVARLNQQFNHCAAHRSVECRTGYGCVFVDLCSCGCSGRGILLHGSVFFGTTVCEEFLCREWKELEQKEFHVVLSQLHVAIFGECWVFGVFIRIYVVRSFNGGSANLSAEFRYNRHRSLAVFAQNKVDELVRLVGVVGFAVFAVDSHVHCLSAHDLACWSNQRHQAGVATNLWNELHGFFEHVLGAECAQVSHHVAVHTARNFGVLNDFVGFRETEIFFYAVASFEHCFFINSFAGFDGFVEQGVDFGRKHVVQWVEFFWEIVLVEVDSSQALASIVKLFAYVANSFHVTFKLDAHLLGKDVDEFDCRSGRTFGKPPDVGVENVHAVHHSHHARCQAVAWCTVSVEVDRHVDGSFELRHKGGNACRVDKSCHILYGYDFCSKLFVSFGFFNKIFVGEDFLCICVVILGVDGVTNSAVGYAAKFVDDFHRFLNVVEIVQGIKDAHDSKSVLDCFNIETFDYVCWIRCVAEEVTAARKGSEV